MRRALAAATALLALLLPVTSAGAAATPPTVVGDVAKSGDHSVRVTVKAAGDLSASQVAAQLGTKSALITGLHRVGPARPLHLVFAIDTSGSMAGSPITAAIAAGQRLLEAVGKGDQVGLVVFDDTARTVAPRSGNIDAVRNALGSISTAEGTALYDGILQATRMTAGNPDAKRVVVVLSDGADTSSTTTLDKLLSSLSSGGVEVDALGLTSSGSFTDDALRKIADASGGQYVPTASVRGLEPIMAQLAQQRLATRYAVDIALPHSSSRSLDVSVKGAPAAHVSLPAGVSAPSYGFWRTHGHWVVLGIGVGAVLVISLLLLNWATNRPRTLTSRLSPYSADTKTERAAHESMMTELYESLEHELSDRWAWKRLQQLNERAGVSAPTGQIAVLIVASALVPVALLTAVFGLPISLLGLLAGPLPVAVLRSRGSRRQRQFDAQLPELLSVWASALRAGRSFAQALDTIVDEAADPARMEFRRAQHQVRLGVPIEQALDEMSQRLGSESFELVVLTTDVQRRIGGNVAEIFDQVSETVRKRQQFAARVRALVAMGVLSARVLLAMPFAIAGMLTALNRDYMDPLLTTSIGHWLIALALVMMTVGFLVLRRMVRPRAVA
jgi:tight adherence protein B